MKSFDCFFEKYKELLKERDSTSPKRKLDTRIRTTIITIALIMVCCILLLVFRNTDVLSSSLAFFIMVCCIILFANIDPYLKVAPDEKSYRDHIARVIGLLNEYGVDNTDYEKIKSLITFTKDIIPRRDPLADLSAAIVTTGSIAAVVIPAFSTAITGSIDFIESIPYIIIILMFALGVSLYGPYLFNFFTKLIFPNKVKYQLLIDDLNQLLMFNYDKIVPMPPKEGRVASSKKKKK